MIYTDGIHLVADRLEELHLFAKSIGLKRSYFEGVKKHHPHYDLMSWKRKMLWCGQTKQTFHDKALKAGAKLISRKEAFLISKAMMDPPTQTKLF